MANKINYPSNWHEKLEESQYWKDADEAWRNVHSHLVAEKSKVELRKLLNMIFSYNTETKREEIIFKEIGIALVRGNFGVTMNLNQYFHNGLRNDAHRIIGEGYRVPTLKELIKIRDALPNTYGTPELRILKEHLEGWVILNESLTNPSHLYGRNCAIGYGMFKLGAGFVDVNNIDSDGDERKYPVRLIGIRDESIDED